MDRDLTDIVNEGEALGVVAGVAASIPVADDQTAAQVPFTPTGTLAATDVQAALAELDTEKATSGHSHSAPAASVVTITDSGAYFTATNVEDALQEIGAGGLGGGGGSAPELIHVRDEKASGTNAGTPATGSWQTRTLNTVKTNEITGASLASNEVTLPAGTYEVSGSVPAMRTNNHQARLYNVTAAATLLNGTSEFSTLTGSYGSQSRSSLDGKFTLASSSAIRVEHWCSASEGAYSLGLAASTGQVEVYTELLIRKVA